MKVAVASGKGGTGKTLLATSLALAWGDVAYLDCDVEGPNGHIFLEPRITETREVTVPVPRVDTGLCRLHGRCAEFCRYNAIAVLPTGWVLFDELCASCGGCSLVCPEGAIREIQREVGTLARGILPGGAPFAEGALRTGEARAVPVIREVLHEAPTGGDAILDSPPGASCPMLTVVEAADVVLLVAEPTPFGLHDLELAVRAVREVGRPMAVVVNRSDWGGREVHRLCSGLGIPILLEIPHFREVAEGYARGVPLIVSRPGLREKLEALRPALSDLAGRAAA